MGAVAGAVVGHHTGHDDSSGREERVCAFPETGGGLLPLVGEDLRVRQPGVVVDGAVQTLPPSPRRFAGSLSAVTTVAFCSRSVRLTGE